MGMAVAKLGARLRRLIANTRRNRHFLLRLLMIHYHGGPLSGPSDQSGRFYKGRHILVSFAYPSHLPVVADVAKTFVFDNGAFTTWKSGKPFDFQAYSLWVREWYRHPGFQWCLIPDSIDGDEEINDGLIDRWKSDRLTHDVPSVPVWHLHETPERLRRLADDNATVALGSSGKWSSPGNQPWWDRINEVMPFICDEHGRPCCKLHGLRMLDEAIFTLLPFASADSTNACQNAGDKGHFGYYTPLSSWQRANRIADHIEGFNSAAVWSKSEQPTFKLA